LPLRLFVRLQHKYANVAEDASEWLAVAHPFGVNKERYDGDAFKDLRRSRFGLERLVRIGRIPQAREKRFLIDDDSVCAAECQFVREQPLEERLIAAFFGLAHLMHEVAQYLVIGLILFGHHDPVLLIISGCPLFLLSQYVC
jgi:hypothetical protein